MKRIFSVIILILLISLAIGCGEKKIEHIINGNIKIKLPATYKITEYGDFSSIVDKNNNYVVYITSSYFSENRSDLEARRKYNEENDAGKIKDYKLAGKDGYYVNNGKSIIIEITIDEKKYLQVVLENYKTAETLDEIFAAPEIKEILKAIKIK